MSDFELTPEEKRQVIAERMRQYKGRRFDAQVTLELANKLPDDDAYKKPQIDQATKEITSLEKLMVDLQEIDENVENSSNGNRAERRAQLKGVKDK
jgi:polyhydroxyalkanoate synthesis regulator phasin